METVYSFLSSYDGFNDKELNITREEFLDQVCKTTPEKIVDTFVEFNDFMNGLKRAFKNEREAMK